MAFSPRKLISIKKVSLLVTILVILLIVPCGCAARYYSNYEGQVTKGYKKPPKRWKKPRSRYLEPKIPRKERKKMEF